MKVAGHNYFSILCAESNNKSSKNLPAISPPVNSRLDVNSLLSYSVYDDHSVWVLRDGRAFAIGNGTNGKICGKFPQSLLKKQTEISITDSNGKQCIFLSAVCGTWYTLYLLQTQDGPDHLKLAYSCYNKEIDTPVFINTGDLNPVALYGGSLTSAAIDQEGTVILITESIIKSPKSKPPTVILPGNERAVSVGCLEQSFFILSESGAVYKCTPSPKNDTAPELKRVEELSEMRIVQISATAAHCLAVTSDGRVFGHGLNENGRIGISSPFSKIFTFQQVTELKTKRIIGAYAGCNHSLFMTEDGSVFGCGSNYYGELFLEDGPTENDIVQPTQTIIKDDATFCITGIFLSAIFVGADPPPNCPNLRFDEEYPEFANPKLDINLPSDFTSMNTSEVDQMVLRPLTAFDELKQFDEDYISSSVSNFEPKGSQGSPLPSPLNKDVIDINMVSGSSQKKTGASDKNRPSSKGEQNPISSILGLGEKLVNNDSEKASSKGDQKQLSAASSPKKASSRASKEESEKQKNISDTEKSKNSAKNEEKQPSSQSKSIKSAGGSKLSGKSNDKLDSNNSKASKSSKNTKPEQQEATTKEAEQPIASILGIGSQLLNNDGNSAASKKSQASQKSKASTKSNEKPLSSQHSKANDSAKSNEKPLSSQHSAKPDEASEKNQQSVLRSLNDAASKLKSDGNGNSGAATKRSGSNAPSDKGKASSKGAENQMSSAASLDDKTPEKSGKAEIASNSMTHSISSEKIKPDSRNEDKRSSKNPSSAANRDKSDAKSQKGMESSAKSKASTKSKNDNNNSAEKNSQASKGDQNPINALLKATENLGNKDNSGNNSKNDAPLSSASATKKLSSHPNKEESEKQKTASEAEKSKSSAKGDEKPPSSQSKSVEKAINNSAAGSKRSMASENNKLSDKNDDQLASQNSKASKSSKNTKPEQQEVTTKEAEQPIASILDMGNQLLNNDGNSAASKKSQASQKSKASTKSNEKQLSSQHSNADERSANISANASKHSIPSDKSKASQKSQDKTPQEKNLSSTSNPKNASSDNKASVKQVKSPKTTERDLSKDSNTNKSPNITGSSDEKPFYFEPSQEKRLSSGSKLSVNTELANLRQQNNEMKELLASKDREITRLTKLNETFIGSNKDLQSHLVECWDNQQHKIDKLDNMNSKRRKK